MISITAYEYRQSDIDPYNEVSIGAPVTLDKKTPIFTGILRKLSEMSLSYHHHLPVTTEISQVVGTEFAGYPKFITEIQFTEEGDWLICRLNHEDQNFLALTGCKLVLTPYPRIQGHPITFCDGYLLRSEMVLSGREMGSSNQAEDVRLNLGDHPNAQELKDLNLERMLAYHYCPHAQGILTPVIQSFAG